MTTFLSASQLARMRADAAKMRPDTCTISSVGHTSDGAGGSTEALTTVATVSCRLDPIGTKSGGIEVAAMREALDSMYQLTVPYDADIRVGYRITHNSKQYEIRQLSNEHSWNVSRRALVARID